MKHLHARTLLALGAAISIGHAQPFSLRFDQPALDRWMYPFNTTPGTRPSAPIFGTLGDDAGVDTRHGQFLVGFETSGQVTTNLGGTNYHIHRARLTATINRGESFAYDPTGDSIATYFETNHPDYQPDIDQGRPIELFGAGFRNGFNAATFPEDGPFGGSGTGERNVFAAGYDVSGALVDVGNNVGKTNSAYPPFEAHPFAIGQTTDVAPGEVVPSGTIFRFDLNLADPLVMQYLQSALDGGRLRLILSSLSTSSFGGLPGWPEFFTRDSLLGDAPTLDIEGAAISPTDNDGDALPDDWERFYFASLNQDNAGDADGDGQSNGAEFGAGTNPNDNTSFLRVTTFEREEPGEVRLRFSYAANRGYVIEHSSDLKTWARVTSPKLIHYVEPGVVEWRDDGTMTGGLAPRRFYRVSLR